MRRKREERVGRSMEEEAGKWGETGRRDERMRKEEEVRRRSREQEGEKGSGRTPVAPASLECGWVAPQAQEALPTAAFLWALL